MDGNVTWQLVYLLSGVILTVGVGVGTVLWNVRGMFATLEKTLSDRIDKSRHDLRDELTGYLLRLEAELHQHRQDDAELFRNQGERIARIEAKQ